MNKLFFYILITLIIVHFCACSLLNYLFEEPGPSEEEIFLRRLQTFTQTTLFNVDYNALRLNPDSFKENKIRVFGVVIQEFNNDFILFTNPFEDNEYGFYRILIDSPLPKSGDYPKPLKYIGRGSEISVFGIYKGLTTINPERISQENKVLNSHIDFRRLKDVPTIEGVAIFDRSDGRFERPLWVSQKFISENYK